MPKRYVALGSSMAAGPGIRPRAPGSPRAAGRSARNYPHLVAAALGLDLVDVTFSGATTAHILTESQHGAAPQAEALDGTETLVTVTIGGNDAGYVPMLFAAGLPARGPLDSVAGQPVTGDGRPGRTLPRPRGGAASRSSRWAGCSAAGHRMPRCCSSTTSRCCPHAARAPPLDGADVTLGRHVAETLERLTAEAAEATGCALVRAGAASREHHAWSAQPWTTRFGWPVPGRPAPLHPNAAGMRAVAELVAAALPS